MTIQYWDYDANDDTITFKLDTGGRVACDMRHEIIRYGVDLAHELDFTDDTAKDVCFMLYSLPYTALQIVQWATVNHDAIRLENMTSDEAPYLQSEFI
jgi:hypothetical protein